ncbi:MAG: hypothetical protein HYU64_19485 [Armatimonadetes bacterium]|nr:hypothetical protein [Armatimonadota bacterium]
MSNIGNNWTPQVPGAFPYPYHLLGDCRCNCVSLEFSSPTSPEGVALSPEAQAIQDLHGPQAGAARYHLASSLVDNNLPQEHQDALARSLMTLPPEDLLVLREDGVTVTQGTAEQTHGAGAYYDEGKPGQHPTIYLSESYLNQMTGQNGSLTPGAEMVLYHETGHAVYDSYQKREDIGSLGSLEYRTRMARSSGGNAAFFGPNEEEYFANSYALYYGNPMSRFLLWAVEPQGYALIGSSDPDHLSKRPAGSVGQLFGEDSGPWGGWYR